MLISINRNIVECKEKGYYVDPNSIDVLIETLWNVKTMQTMIRNSLAVY